VALSAPFVVLGAIDDSEPAEGSAVEERSAQLARESQVRDRRQVQDLTQQTTAIAGELGPTLSELAAALPPGEGQPGPTAAPAAVDQWRRRARDAHAYFAETVSGETATNVARGALAAGLGALVEATELYRLALATPGSRRALLTRAGEWRDIAMDMLSVGTTQLDAVNHSLGFGHHHVFFAR
jgi:hypothetical protein